MTERLRSASNATFRSLRTRNFRLFFTGQAISQAGTWMQSVAIIWVVLDLTDNGFAVDAMTRIGPPGPESAGGAAVWNDHVTSAPSALPVASVTVAPIRAVYVAEGARALAGLSVAVRDVAS